MVPYCTICNSITENAPKHDCYRKVKIEVVIWHTKFQKMYQAWTRELRPLKNIIYFWLLSFQQFFVNWTLNNNFTSANSEMQRRIHKAGQTSKMENFAKIDNGWKLLIIFPQSSILDVWLGFEYASEVYSVFYWRCTAPKMKLSIKDFFSKCDQICSFLQIWSKFYHMFWLEVVLDQKNNSCCKICWVFDLFNSLCQLL